MSAQLDNGYGATADPDWRGVDWLRHVHKLGLGSGGELSYADIGDGEPAVVFIHGLGGQWRNWLENLPAIARVRRAVALDLPGFGGSTMPAEGVSIPGYARVVDELCERLDLGPVVVVGNSMGGFVGAELAVSQPARVERLVLVDAAGIVPTRAERWRAVPYLWATAVLGARLAAAHRQVAARPGLRRAALRLVANDPGRLRADLVYHGLLDSPRPAVREALRAALGYLTYDWADRLPEARCPTLVVWGDSDALIPVRHSAEFARRIEGARVVTLEGTGHIPMVERPEAFNRALLDFIGERKPTDIPRAA
jgi:pimeloyl-ACP methyl ester carboxylesterase